MMIRDGVREIVWRGRMMDAAARTTRIQFDRADVRDCDHTDPGGIDDGADPARIQESEEFRLGKRFVCVDGSVYGKDAATFWRCAGVPGVDGGPAISGWDDRQRAAELFA